MLSKKKKEKLRQRIRDSSQESVKGETTTKTKSTRGSNDKKTTKSGRRLPEHIKREVDEFEFDDELDFDEELRRLKSKSSRKKTGDDKNENVDREGLSSPDVESPSSARGQRSRSASLSKQTSVETREVEAKSSHLSLNTNQGSEVGLGTDLVASVDVVDGDVSQETPGKDPSSALTPDCTNLPQVGRHADETSKVEDKQVTIEAKPKRRTKIIKKKVIRVIKVPRKKAKDGTALTSPTDGQIISQTIVKKEDLPARDIIDSRDDSSVAKRRTNEVENESPNKKVKVESKSGEVTKRTVISSKSRILSPEKKKELLKRRQAAGKSTVKAKQLIAEVQAKKEAEKKQLLERAKKSQVGDKKLKESDEKKRKYERYLMLKKKSKEKALAEKKRKAQKSDASESSENKSSPTKTPKRKKSVQRTSSEEGSVDGRKRPDQHFYKPGEAKLKTISEQSKKQIQKSDERKQSSNRKTNEENGDVLKSKITSIKNVINSPEKRRFIKTSVSEEESDLRNTQSSDEKTSRRVVKLGDKRSGKERSGIVSRVEKIDSRTSRTSDRDSKRRGSVEIKESRHSRHYDDDDRRSSKETAMREREKEYERREKKRLLLLEREKEESMEREKLALREKEYLERKLERERQLRKEMEKEREEEERSRRKEEKREKRKSRGGESEDERKRPTGKRSKKNKLQAIDVLDSDNEEKQDEDESVEKSSVEGTEKKRKKKSKRKREKKKKKKVS